MREIIHLQSGHCGNLLGTKFLESICDEHSLDPMGCYCGDSDMQLEHINVFFAENVAHSPYGSLIRPSNLISGGSSAKNNWAIGHYTEGAALLEFVLDAVRRETEMCDSVQGFQLVHATGGGTGAGMGTLLVEKLREKYEKQVVETYSVYSSPSASSTPVDPYNSLLSTFHLLNHAQQVLILDNESISSILYRCFKINSPALRDLNHLASMAIVGVTSMFRLPTAGMNYDMRKLVGNLVPFPRLLFLTVALAPLTAPGFGWIRYLTTPEVIKQVFDPKSVLCACDPSTGCYLSSTLFFRGRCLTTEFGEHLQATQRQYSKNFSEWIPDSLKVSMIDIPPKGMKRMAGLLGNTTAIQEMFRRISDQFSVLLRRKAYLHWYTEEGMDEMEFTEAESSVRDLISEYQEVQEMQTEDEDEGEWEEEEEAVQG